jgi:hypothetical protein
MTPAELSQFVENPISVQNDLIKLGQFSIQGSVGGQQIVRSASHRVKGLTIDFKRYRVESSRGYFKFVIEDDLPRGVNQKKVTCTQTNQHGSTVLRCYFLIWSADHCHALDLPANGNRLFLTAPLNGCAVMINGPRNNPLVVHANVSNQLPEPNYPPNAGIEEIGRIRNETRLQQWTAAYSAYATDLIKRYIFDSNYPTTICDPEFYFQCGGAQARVFGLRDVDGWTFYYNIDLSRRKRGGQGMETKSFTGTLWPKRQEPSYEQVIKNFIKYY